MDSEDCNDCYENIAETSCRLKPNILRIKGLTDKGDLRLNIIQA